MVGNEFQLLNSASDLGHFIDLHKQEEGSYCVLSYVKALAGAVMVLTYLYALLITY